MKPRKAPALLARIRKQQCIACGSTHRIEAHHIKTKGSGGGDDDFNLLALCSDCHTQAEYAWHRGRQRFLEKFPHVLAHIEKLGWVIFNGKLVRDV